MEGWRDDNLPRHERPRVPTCPAATPTRRCAARGQGAGLGDGAGQTYPKAWDSRILPYTKIAEKQRGLLFKHPVAVRFLPPQEFEKTVTTDDKELDKGDRTELKQFTGLMRALGLISGDVDLFAAGDLSYLGEDVTRLIDSRQTC